MARENQGLQIALIILVVLLIVLAVTTYTGYKLASDNDKAKLAAVDTGNKAEAKATVAADEVERLKKLIGAAKTDTVTAIEDDYKKQMKTYAAAYPETDQTYARLIVKQARTIDEKNNQLEISRADVPKLRDEKQMSDRAKDAQLEQFKTQRDKANDDLAAEQAKYQNDRRRMSDDKDKLAADVQTARKEAKEQIDKITADLASASKLTGELKDKVTEQRVKLNDLTSNKVGTPDGEITWVNQRNSAVWINLGRADGLTRQVSFSVYPADVTADATAKGKASIEVTQVLGDHLSEGRVVQDDISNPIIPGDKIATPLWNAGQKRHFALAGLIDIDGDGRSDLQTVLNIIAVNGGVVDCYATDAGKVVGQVTVNTNCLILGEAPTEKTDSKQRDAFTKIQHEASELRIDKVQLADLLQRMGWKNTAPVVRYGRGANPKDFRAKPDEGVPKKSTGRVSDVFEKRQPPKAPPSAY